MTESVEWEPHTRLRCGVTSGRHQAAGPKGGKAAAHQSCAPRLNSSLPEGEGRRAETALGAAQRRVKEKLVALIRRRVFPHIPRHARHVLIRAQLDCDWDAPAELSVGVVDGPGELRDALRILHDAYVRAGFMPVQASGMRITKYHLLPTTTTLVARWGEKVVGTLSLVRKGPFGLPCQYVFPVDEHFARQDKVAEISSLAIASDFRGHHGQVLWPLLKYMYHYCRSYFDVDKLVISVNPSHIDFYEALLRFEVPDGWRVENYGFVNGAPAVGAALDLRKAPFELYRLYASRKRNKNLFGYFVEHEMENLRFPRREMSTIVDPVITPSLLKEMFLANPLLLSELAQEDLQTLIEIYGPDYDFGAGTAAFHADHRRLERRHDVACHARLRVRDQSWLDIELSNVSRFGLRGAKVIGLDEGEIVEAEVVVAPFSVARLEGQVVRHGPQQGFALEILRADDRWSEYIQHLDQRFVGGGEPT